MIRGFERVAHGCFVAGALAWTWRFFAQQAPSSAWHAAGFPGAIEALATHAWITGLAVYVLAPRESPPRALLGVTSAGCVLSLGAQAVSALRGVTGVQIRDARVESVGVLIARLVGAALLFAALALALRTRESAK